MQRREAVGRGNKLDLPADNPRHATYEAKSSGTGVSPDGSSTRGQDNRAPHSRVF